MHATVRLAALEGTSHVAPGPASHHRRLAAVSGRRLLYSVVAGPMELLRHAVYDAWDEAASAMQYTENEREARNQPSMESPRVARREGGAWSDAAHQRLSEAGLLNHRSATGRGDPRTPGRADAGVPRRAYRLHVRQWR